ncbi:MAG TPA: FlgD immunoglobulin-like domain containing protein, partial [Accumulibacter sp.]|nr:FlgD immunoglobulin-like domain containing protein [Accumulibacter sp.]
AAAADQVKVSILDASGAVLQVQNLGARPAGSLAFVWDSKSDSGATMPAGNYRFSVSAVQGGEKVTADPLQLGTVSALVRGKSGFQLELGALGLVDFAKVQQVF